MLNWLKPWEYREMTKFRWNSPPTEHDPAKYEPEKDKKLRYNGPSDKSIRSERSDIINKIIEIDDAIARYSNNDTKEETSGCQIGEDLDKHARLNDFDPSFSIRNSTEAELLVKRIISKLKADKSELQNRLAKIPMIYRF